LDQVYIDYTGVNVHKGDPMVLIWSKTLLASQVELLESMRGGSSESTYGAEEKLIQQGFTREQVEAIKLTKKTTRDVTLLAPISGVVTRKMAVQGQFVKEGQEMYIINDLSRVWVKLDAYESDLPWIKFGQSVTFTTSAVPGRTFSGRVLFIDPVLDMKTRSVKVRVEADNPEFILKPGMFVTAELKAEVDVKGKVIKSEWAGKYICPLHLGDSVSDTPGVCPDSKVALQPASSFGYSDEPHPQPPLMIPTTAPMITGARSIVYVQTEADKPTYELREVTLGPRAEHGYIVYSGLREGERVVTRGNFKIDSAMQIVGKPSMMSGDLSPAAGASSDEETVEKITAPAAFLQSLTPVLQRYDELKSALAAEDAKAAAEAATKMSAAVNSAKAALLTGKAVKSWRKMQGTLNGYLKSFAEQKDVAAQRKVFDPLSENLGRGLLAFRHALPHPVYLFHCEDVGRKGAYWIEMSKEARNPYLPKSACADLVETIPPENAPPAAATQPAHTH
jgi:Cu(I)/Ag(I) efflux system membrane fusion protein